jgi:hypothetical protein
MDEADKLKLAFDDMRVRHKGLLDLIVLTDQQALGLLRLYVTLGAAAASGAVAVLSGETVIWTSASIAFAAATVVFLVGAIFCFRAMGMATVGLPGRGADFWMWAFDPHIDIADIRASYLSEVELSLAINRKLNASTARELAIAKKCGIVAPAITGLVGLIAFGILGG